MLRHKGAYAVSLAATVLLLFVFPKPIILAMIGIEIVLPLLAGLLLRFDISAIDIEIKGVTPIKANTPAKLYFEIKLKRPLIIAAAADVTLDFENQLFKAEKYRSAKISLTRKEKQYAEFLTQMCGEVYIHSVQVKVVDIFGFCTVNLPKQLQTRIMVMPERRDVTILGDVNTRVRPNYGAFSINRKGSDASEVLDIREYAAGDDLKTVHWKLSSKSDELLVKEYCDQTRYDTIVLYDISMTAKGSEIDKLLLSDAVGAAESLSRALARAGLPHMAAFMFGGHLLYQPVSNDADSLDLLYMLLSHPLAEANGGIWQYMLAGELEQAYKNIAYFTAAAFPKELSMIPDDINLTAILLSETGKVPTVKHSSSTQAYVEIPVKYLRDNKSFTIRL